MEKLFSYGTLQMTHVQQEIFKRKLNGHKDMLIGYILGEVKITDEAVIRKSGTNIHPTLKFTGRPADTVEGTVFEVTTSELSRADEYEVDEYLRVEGSFVSGIKAWVYVCANNKAELVPKIQTVC